MTILSRGFAAALVLGAGAAGIFTAHAAKEGGWRQMSAESIARIEDGKIAAARAALKLTPEQESLWGPIEAQVRAQYKARAEKRAEREKKREERRAERAKDGKEDAGVEAPRAPNMAERIERRARRLGEQAGRMKTFSAAFGPFYASLSEDQKVVLGPVMRDLRVMGGERRGHGRRWAHRGGQHGGKGWHRGPGGEKGGPDGNPAADGGEQQP